MTDDKLNILANEFGPATTLTHCNQLIHKFLGDCYSAEIQPFYSVGVVGDARTYGPTMAIVGPRPKKSDWEAFLDKLSICSTKITNNCDLIVRVIIYFE